MEIDITAFFNDADPFNFSASVAERGKNAGRETWGNAVSEGESSPLLTTEDEVEALRAYVKGFGAWDEDEIAAWSDAECNAIFIQMVSGSMREMESCMGDNGEIDWDEYQKLAEEGSLDGNIFCGDDNRIYYYLGG